MGRDFYHDLDDTPQEVLVELMTALYEDEPSHINQPTNEEILAWFNVVNLARARFFPRRDAQITRDMIVHAMSRYEHHQGNRELSAELRRSSELQTDDQIVDWLNRHPHHAAAGTGDESTDSSASQGPGEFIVPAATEVSQHGEIIDMSDQSSVVSHGNDQPGPFQRKQRPEPR